MAEDSVLKRNQAACLELVAQGMTSKEIAKQLGLSPRSVDAYLTAAMAALNASNRREAARIYLSSKLSQELPSQSLLLVEAVETVEDVHRAGPTRLLHTLFPIPLGGAENSLHGHEKLFYSARIGLSGMVLLLAITTTFMGLLSVF